MVECCEMPCYVYKFYINLIEKTINLTIRKLDFHGKMFGNLQNFDIEIAKSMAIHFEAIISSCFLKKGHLVITDSAQNIQNGNQANMDP